MSHTAAGDNSTALSSIWNEILRLLEVCTPPEEGSLTPHNQRNNGGYSSTEAPYFTLYAEPQILADLFSLEGHIAQKIDQEYSGTSTAQQHIGTTLAQLLAQEEFWRAQSEKRLQDLKTEEQLQQNIVLHHFCSLRLMAWKQYKEAAKYQLEALKVFLWMLEHSEAQDNLLIPLLHRVCYNCYHACLAARELKSESPASESKESVSSKGTLDELGSLLRDATAHCISHKGAEQSKNKRWGALRGLNLLLKVALKINNQPLADNALNSVRMLPNMSQFPLPDQVAYHYYRSKYAIHREDFRGADKFLSFTLRNCPRRNTTKDNNRIQLVLNALVPVKLYLGFIIGTEYLRKWGCDHYIPLVEALQSGNSSTYEEAMEDYQIRYIRSGVLSIIAALEKHVIRRLVKRIHFILQEQGERNIDIEYCKHVLRVVSKKEISIAEMECILANLISEGFVQAMIDPKHLKLIPKKNDGFPKLSNTVG